jgi:hypothetical protein
VRREFFAEEAPQGFWHVVEGLHNTPSVGDADDAAPTEEALYAKVVQLADAALSNSSQRLLRYALLSRYYSPKVGSSPLVSGSKHWG